MWILYEVLSVLFVSLFFLFFFCFLQYMYEFCSQTRRQRIIQRNRTERLSDLLDWQTLGQYYRMARRKALETTHPTFFQSRRRSSSGSTPTSPGFHYSRPLSEVDPSELPPGDPDEDGDNH